MINWHIDRVPPPAPERFDCIWFTVYSIWITLLLLFSNKLRQLVLNVTLTRKDTGKDIIHLDSVLTASKIVGMVHPAISKYRIISVLQPWVCILSFFF